MSEVLVCIHERSIKDKNEARIFAREVCKEILATHFRLVKTNKGWGFKIYYDGRKRKKKGKLRV